MIGLLGGSFDPIHTGHLNLAETVLKQYALSKLFLCPAKKNPLKTETTQANAEHRLQMVRMAAAEMNHPKIHILDWEIRSAEPSYTLNTLNRLSMAEKSSIALIVGNEVFATFSKWYQPQKVLELANLIVATREKSKTIDVTSMLQNIQINDFQIQNERVLHSQNSRWIEILKLEALPYSGTALRKLLIAMSCTKMPEDPPMGIQRSVWEFIKENRVYAVRR